jgi:uncharacterized protein (DUF362 family)
MKRRDFLKAAVTMGMTMFLKPHAGVSNLFNGTVTAGEAIASLPDMVAIRNGEPVAMFDAGIAAMGGMGRFVKKGQSVALKPNASFESAPELGSNTNPALVQRIAQHCIEAGASRITVMDHVFGGE